MERTIALGNQRRNIYKLCFFLMRNTLFNLLFQKNVLGDRLIGNISLH